MTCLCNQLHNGERTGDPPLPDNEAARLKELASYAIMYSGAELSFERIAGLVKEFFAIPMVAITFLGEEEQFIKTAVGWTGKLTPRAASFCQYTILHDRPLVVPDAHADPQYATLALVTGEPFLRFYAGAPIGVISEQGERLLLGSLCLLDTHPHPALSDEQLQKLTEFAAIISDTLALRRQQRLAQRSEELKSAFLANISHEIRMPMNGIMGTLDSLTHTPLSPIQAEHVAAIKAGNKQVLNLISDMWQLAQLQAHQLAIVPKLIHLSEWLQQLFIKYQKKADEKNITLRLEYQPDTSDWVYIDPQQLQLIVKKLLINAIDFSHTGSTVRLRVSRQLADKQAALPVQARPQGDDKLLLELFDGGGGIAPRSQAVIFDALGKADKFTHRTYGAIGLGLTLSKSLAHAMGGDLTLRNEPDGGAVFSLSLPYVPHLPMAMSQVQSEPLVTASLEAIDTMPHLPAHVLLAEDNDVNAMVALRILKKYGYTADRAKDGQQAVQLFSTDPNKYQMILMDHQMPIMDGVQATKRLKQQFSHGLPPIIAVTAHATHTDKALYLAAGMQDCLPKPYKPAQLDEIIQHWLHQPSGVLSPIEG